VDEFSYNADGSIPVMNMTRTGVAPVGTLNPYERVEAETMAWSYGVKTTQDGGDVYVTSVGDGDYIKVREVDFATTGAASLVVRAKGTGGGTLKVYADNPRSATPLATLTGKHDLYFMFSGTGDDMMQLDYWQFAAAGSDAVKAASGVKKRTGRSTPSAASR